MGGTGPTTPEDRAQALVDRVQDDPGATRVEALRLLDQSDLSAEAEATARWALGLADRQLNDLEGANAALTKGLDIALAHGLNRRAAQIRSSRSLVWLYRGDTHGALDEARIAADGLDGGDLARNQMQVALILQRLGDLSGAIGEYERAQAGLQAVGDRLAETRLLANRGVLHGYLGDLDAGVADLTAAIDLARQLGQGLLLAGCSHNLGFLEGRRGDVPTALEWFDRAGDAYDELGRPPGMMEALWSDRARLLLTVGLFEEAATTVDAALDGLNASGNVTDLAEARLLAAEVALAMGAPERAQEHAERAAHEFVEQERPSWGLLADYAQVRARFAMSDDSLRPDDVATIAASLAESGLTIEANDCRLVAGRVALRSGDLETAGLHLRGAAGARDSGPAVGRAQAWLAEALLRTAQGNRRGAARAIDAGIRVIRDYRATLGASELRTHAAAHGLELARLATRQALRAGSPWRVLRAVEDWRAISRQVAPVTPPADPELVTLLAELRHVDSEARAAALAGRRPEQLRRERVRLENRIRSIERHAHGSSAEITATSWHRDRVLQAIGDHDLISFFTHDEHIHTIVVADGAARVHRRISVEQARSDVAALLFALNRLAIGMGSSRSLAAATAALDGRGAALREGLLGMVPASDRHAVIIPTGVLHRLPWSMLLPHRPVSVAPSLEAWSVAASRAAPLDSRPSASLVAGPELAAAELELSSIAPLYEEPRVLVPPAATAEAVIDVLDGAEVAHIAAHGSFRADNPAFSSLQMSDGPLTVYDLERIDTAPRLMVLSSCDTGVAKVVAGDELLGLSAALIEIGAANLIAPVVPISDELTPPLMELLHREIAAGLTPAAALLALRPTADHSPAERALRSSFVCMGA